MAHNTRSPDEVPCALDWAKDTDATLVLDVEGVQGDEQWRVYVLTPGMDHDELVAHAVCRGSTAKLALAPLDGPVRILAVVDVTDNGDSIFDRGGALPGPVQLVAGQRVQGKIKLSVPEGRRDVIVPHDLNHGLYPVLDHMIADHRAADSPTDFAKIIAVIMHPDLREEHQLSASLEVFGTAAEKAQLGMNLQDILDRPDTPLDAFAGLLVQDHLAGTLAAQVQAKLATTYERVDGWTDRQGNGWTLLARKASAPAYALGAEDELELLPLGRGWQLATEGRGPRLPPPLEP